MERENDTRSGPSNWLYAGPPSDGSPSIDLQRDALLAAEVDPLNQYEDHASGKKDGPPELAACLNGIRTGDTLLAWKLGRLGRNLRHLVNTVHDLTERDFGLKVLTGEGSTIDTTTAGKLVIGCSTSKVLGVWSNALGSCSAFIRDR